jgi:tripartite-type tricarboxylate transporter receptor subunit TctC
MARIAWLVAIAVLLAAAQAFARDDAAANYPNRAVKIIAASPAGGGLDIATRVIADRLAKMWDQPFVVENRSGASGNLGTEAVAQAEPDGYTLLAAQPAPLTTNIVLYKKLNFDPAAFEFPLASAQHAAIVITAPPQAQSDSSERQVP